MTCGRRSYPRLLIVLLVGGVVSLLERQGSGGPSGLQNQQAVAAPRLDGSIPSPLRRAETPSHAESEGDSSIDSPHDRVRLGSAGDRQRGPSASPYFPLGRARDAIPGSLSTTLVSLRELRSCDRCRARSQLRTPMRRRRRHPPGVAEEDRCGRRRLLLSRFGEIDDERPRPVNREINNLRRHLSRARCLPVSVAHGVADRRRALEQVIKQIRDTFKL
jgi:hypothetical protein